jgi:tellurite methyltransferase
MKNKETWDNQHRGRPVGAPEPFLAEMIDRLPRGLALDVASGRGRNALALARAGIRVVAVDYSLAGIRTLAEGARIEKLAVWPVVANLDDFHFRPNSFDAIVKVNYLDRSMFPKMIRALRPGGVLLADTYLIDQAVTGHPSDPAVMLQHGELRALVARLRVELYREGLVTFSDGTQAHRASVVARREGSN